MQVHCNEPLSVLHKHTQYSTLIIGKEKCYSWSPRHEQWEERGDLQVPHLWWHVISLGDECSVLELWLTRLTLRWSEFGGNMRLEWISGWTVIPPMSAHCVGQKRGCTYLDSTEWEKERDVTLCDIQSKQTQLHNCRLKANKDKSHPNFWKLCHCGLNLQNSLWHHKMSISDLFGPAWQIWMTDPECLQTKQADYETNYRFQKYRCSAAERGRVCFGILDISIISTY